MYRVVGCGGCGALWIIEGRPETSECPRCGARRPLDRRRTLFESEEADAAREARGRLLAERQDDTGESFADLADAVDDAGPDDETYLAESGVDPAAAAEAGDRATASTPGRSREETVRAAIREAEAPTHATIEQYCEARGVPPEMAADLLEKLVSAGEVAREDGTYRLL